MGIKKNIDYYFSFQGSNAFGIYPQSEFPKDFSLPGFVFLHILGTRTERISLFLISAEKQKHLD